MKIKYFITTGSPQKNFRHNWMIRRTKSFIVVLLLLTTFYRVGAQTGPFTNVRYNDSRTIVILPNVSQTQRPGESTVNADTRQFCSDNNFLFISSSTRSTKVSHDYSAYLQFSLAALPEGAIVDTVDIMVYLSKVKNNSSVFEQGVNLYELNSPKGNNTIDIADSSSSAMSLVSKDDTIQAIHLLPDVTDGANWAAKRKGNLYFVLAAEEAETYRYYAERSNNMPKQPKLVIKYHMPNNQVTKNSWPQYKYDAQHTGMLAWQSNATATGFTLRDVYSPPGSNFIKSDPMVFDDKLFFAFQSSAPPMYRLRAISMQGNLLAETSTTDTIGLIKYGPVADRSHNIYCITGNAANTLAVLNTDNLQVTFRKPLENSAQAIAIPVIGFDGSLYISTNKGIYAYTPHPECKLKWVYTSSTNKFGPVALDETEEVVYVYNGAVGSVAALNSIDGIKKWAATGMPTFTENIPVPTAKNGRVYVTNALRKGNKFYMIDAGNGSITKTISNTGDVISQPVLGVNKVYIINNGQLEAYSLSDGTKLPNASPAGLNAASALVTDANSNVYILNTEQGRQSLTLVPSGGTDFPVRPIEDAKGYLMGNRLLLSPQGSLLAGNDNHIYGFSPTGFTEKRPITIPLDNGSNFNSEYMYRSENAIKVAAKTIGAKQNVVIHSGSSIGFQPGFGVQSGATLSCKTGY